MLDHRVGSPAARAERSEAAAAKLKEEFGAEADVSFVVMDLASLDSIRLGYKMGIKTIQFDDMNWDADYHQNTTYSQSKLAQMMLGYELHDRLAAANKNVGVYVCHPGSSNTSLITTSGTLVTRAMFQLMTQSPLVQSAEKGSYPEVRSATEVGTLGA